METIEQLEKARIYAYWGFSGFVCPIIGIIASAISISILDRMILDDEGKDVVEEHARLRSVANTAKGWSIFLLVACVIAGIFGALAISDSLKPAAQTIETTSYSNY